MIRLGFWAVCCAACLSAGPSWAQRSFWENGDFLRPQPKAGSFLVIDTGERYGTWRVVGASGNVEWISGAYKHDGFQFLAQGATPTMNTWVNLAGLSQSATGIAHEPVPTTVGSSYTLTFYVGNIYDPGGPYGTSSKVAVYENSTLLGTYTNGSGQGSTAENWQLFTVTFNADAPYTTIAFINGDAPGDLNCGIDNINFEPTALAAAMRQR